MPTRLTLFTLQLNLLIFIYFRTIQAREYQNRSVSMSFMYFDLTGKRKISGFHYGLPDFKNFGKISKNSKSKLRVLLTQS